MWIGLPPSPPKEYQQYEFPPSKFRLCPEWVEHQGYGGAYANPCNLRNGSDAQGRETRLSRRYERRWNKGATEFRRHPKGSGNDGNEDAVTIPPVAMMRDHINIVSM